MNRIQESMSKNPYLKNAYVYYNEKNDSTLDISDNNIAAQQQTRNTTYDYTKPIDTIIPFDIREAEEDEEE